MRSFKYLTIFLILTLSTYVYARPMSSGPIGPTGGGATISDDAYGVGWNGVTDVGASQNALWDVISGLGGGHNAVTLTPQADNIFDLVIQVLGLDVQGPNIVFAGPTVGAPTFPNFRGLVDNDIPDTITINNATNAVNATIAVTANGGDSATGFFPAGTIEHEYGGLEADVSAYTGVVGISGGATAEVDTAAELETYAGLGAFFNEYADDANAAAMRTTLGLIIGTDVLAPDGDGSALTGLQFDQFITQTAWRVFYSNAAGDVTELALGADGEYLMSNGAAVAPTFETPAGAGDVSAAAVMTDHTLVRGDGGAKGVQDTGIAVDDSDNMSGVGTLSAGAAGFTVDADGDTAAKSLTVDPSPTPTLEFHDSDGLGADKFSGSIFSNMTDTTDGAEDSDVTISYMDAGTPTNALIIDGSDNEIIPQIPVNMASETIALSTVVGVIDTGTATSFELPNGNAGPSVLGQLRVDTTVANHTDGALRWYDSNNIRHVVDMVAATAEGCTDDQVVAYDADADLFYCKADAGGAETNSLETTITAIADKEVFIGDGADSGTFTVISGGATLDNNGVLTQETQTVVDPNGFTMSAAQGKGFVIYATGAGTIVAPPVVVGLNFTIIDYGGAAVVLDPDATGTEDYIILDGTLLAQGAAVTSTSTTGDIISCVYQAADIMYCASGSPDGDHWTGP